MAIPKFEVHEQTTLEVDGQEYLVTAMPATQGLIFLEKHQSAIDSGKADLSQMKNILCPALAITEKAFDIKFSRKYAHLQKLYQAVLEYNFSDVFQAPDTNE